MAVHGSSVSRLIGAVRSDPALLKQRGKVEKCYDAGTDPIC
jgi:hypothetical protein